MKEYFHWKIKMIPPHCAIRWSSTFTIVNWVVDNFAYLKIIGKTSELNVDFLEKIIQHLTFLADIMKLLQTLIEFAQRDFITIPYLYIEVEIFSSALN